MYLHVLLKTICLILAIPFSCGLVNKTNNNSTISQSIHSIFLFLEDRLPKSSRVLKIEMSQSLHLETLVRLFRRRVKDVPFLHLLRIVTHAYKILYGTFIQPQSWKQKEHESIDMLLQNFFNYEIDSILLLSWKQIYKLQPRSLVLSDKNNVNLKNRCVSKYTFKLDKLSTDNYFIRSLCLHFGRYKNRSIIAFHGTQYFVKKWIYYISIFNISHFHYPIEFIKIHSNSLSTSCVSFLGYVSTSGLTSKDVHIETMIDSYNSRWSGEKNYPRIPFLLLVKFLEKEKFCNSNGYPISKLSWAVLADDDILNRFTKIWNTLSSYHSASIDQYGLRKLRYIPRLSCDSTLAGKHKSTIRFLRRRFDLELPRVVPVCDKFNLFKINKRVWHLNLNCSVLLTFI